MNSELVSSRVGEIGEFIGLNQDHSSYSQPDQYELTHGVAVKEPRWALESGRPRDVHLPAANDRTYGTTPGRETRYQHD